jgi:hypothetical protein
MTIIENCPDSLTFIFIGRIHLIQQKTDKLPKFSQQFGGNYMWYDRQKRIWSFESQPNDLICVTKQMYHYFKQYFVVSIDYIEAIFFARACPYLSECYNDMTTYRFNAAALKNTLLKTCYKQLINFSTGYFACNNNTVKQTSNKSIIHSTVWKKNVSSKSKFDLIGSFNDIEFHIRKKTPVVNAKKIKNLENYKSSVNLMTYIFITEAGKSRLHECLYYMYLHMKPFSFKLLYSNTDNLVLAFSDSEVFNCVDPNLQLAFKTTFSDYLTRDLSLTPGKLKHEWITIKNVFWQFVSPQICTYVLNYPSKNQMSGVSKFSGLKNVEIEQSFSIADNLFKNLPVQVTQQRRINKKITLDKKTVVINLNSKK